MTSSSPPPPNITAHPPSLPKPPAIIRSASLPVPLVEERGETIRQASNSRHLITPSHRHPPHLIRPHSHRQTHGADKSHDNRNRHGAPHIDTVPASKQARRDTRPDTQPSRSPCRTSEKTRTGRDERHRQPRSPNEHGQASNRPPPHRLPDETNGTRNGSLL